jgi:membrane-associated phospholipid phosphatase
MGKRNAIGFLLPAILFVVGAFLVSMVFSRGTIHMVMNGWNRPFLDPLFRVWSYLGEGWVLMILILFTLFVRIRIALGLFIAYAVSGLSAQLLKQLFFRDLPRPVKYFEMMGIETNLHLVPGVEVHMWKSFPSGHAAAAFGVFFGLSLFLRSRSLQLLLFILALGVAYSRIYMSQHFLVDAAGGGVLGLIGGYTGWIWIGRYKREWLDRPLINSYKS